jgi:hypothetical protein
LILRIVQKSFVLAPILYEILLGLQIYIMIYGKKNWL